MHLHSSLKDPESSVRWLTLAQPWCILLKPDAFLVVEPREREQSWKWSIKIQPPMLTEDESYSEVSFHHEHISLPQQCIIVFGDLIYGCAMTFPDIILSLLFFGFPSQYSLKWYIMGVLENKKNKTKFAGDQFQLDDKRLLVCPKYIPSIS